MRIRGGKFVVFGAAGSVGLALTTLLSRMGASTIFAVVKDAAQQERLNKIVMERELLRCFVRVADVRNIEQIRTFAQSLRNPIVGLSGVIYAVGHCPPGGIMAEVGTPLDRLPSEKLVIDHDLHVVGLQNVTRGILPLLRFGAHVVVIGSAVTRLPRFGLPANLFNKFHAGSYAQAKAAQLELVRWWQRSPTVKSVGVFVDYLGFGAIDTPFHRGLPDGQGPPSLISLDEVGARVVWVILGSVPVIKFTRTVSAPIAKMRWGVFQGIFDKRGLPTG